MARDITTAGELLRAGDIGRCELVRGELRRMIPAGYEHGRVTMNLSAPTGRARRAAATIPAHPTSPSR